MAGLIADDARFFRKIARHCHTVADPFLTLSGLFGQISQSLSATI